MAKKRTEKNRYPSRYSPLSYVHAAQYVTELICEKKAKSDNKDGGKELPLKFWESSKEWLKFYKYQIMLANRLIKEFGEHSIIAALHDKRMFKTYSLRSPFLEKIIKEYVVKENLAKEIMRSKTIEFNRSDDKTFGQEKKKNSIISKLKGLE